MTSVLYVVLFAHVHIVLTCVTAAFSRMVIISDAHSFVDSSIWYLVPAESAKILAARDLTGVEEALKDCGKSEPPPSFLRIQVRSALQTRLVPSIPANLL